MSVQTLFGFQGRVRRSTWWFIRIAITALLIVPFVIMAATASPPAPGSTVEPDSPMRVVGFLIFIVLIVPAIWIDMAITVKRWHDRNKSGWMIFISLIPLIGPMWLLVECGFLDGTRGPNRFGESPKGLANPETALVFD